MNKFLIRSHEDYYEYNLIYCGKIIKNFKKSYFKKNSKSDAKIYAKKFFPQDCPEKFWMHYLVFEVAGKIKEVTSITREAFDTLILGIEPTNFESIEFYTIETFKKQIN